MPPLRRCFSYLALLLIPGTAAAHPVPRGGHDRVIVVRLTPATVVVEYQLEVEPFTAIFQDLRAIDEKTIRGIGKEQEFFEVFARSYAPILADNLLASLDGNSLTFRCTRRSHQVTQPDGNLRCDFVFEAPWHLGREGRHKFTFWEGNYELEPGLINLSLACDPALTLLEKTAPDEALKTRAAVDLKPGDEARLRQLKATLSLSGEVPAAAETAPAPAPPPPGSGPAGEENRLFALLLDSERGFWVLMLLAAGFGAAHALTPGHGKTLVAAYLVGERGTVAHAIVLGLVTTITHTGAVILLAAALVFFFPRAVPAQLQMALGLGGGLLVAGLGLWLLLRRLGGSPDHIHIGGHGHHHHHHHGAVDHYHDEHGHAHPLSAGTERVGWWGLIVLGMSGGIVPCWDAILMFGFAVAAQRLWLGLPLLLAFSAGLASVLILIGIGVVYVKGFATARFGSGRLVRALPLVSAVLVTGLGLWLCYDSLHPQAVPPAAAVRSQP
jgi:ABC-type nickel/cobalt efflux system permease component RcnA